MSLINQMLQELDARRPGQEGGAAFGQEIRSVSAPRRMHPAWWLVVLLALILAALLLWLALRSSDVADSRTVAAQLPSEPKLASAAGKGASRLVSLQSSLRSEPVEQRHLMVQPTPSVVAEAASTSMPATGRPDQRTGMPVTVADLSAIEPIGMAPAVDDRPSEQPAHKIEYERPRAEHAEPATPSMSREQKQSESDEAPESTISRKLVKELTPQQRAENVFRQALISNQQGRAAEAIDRLERALKLDAQHVAARHTLIGLLLDSKRRGEAIRVAEEGLHLDSRQVGLAMILARLQLEQGALQAAIETLQRTLPYAGGQSDYHALLAALLQRDEQHAAAAEQYLSALKKEPQNGIWWMGLGISLQAQHRNTEARKAFERARTSNDLSADLLAFVESRLGQLSR